MSRGGRGGRGWRGGGRGGFGASNLPPMGLTFTDIQNLTREASALYPSLRVPVFTDSSSDEKRIVELQLGFAERMRKSQYYIVEKTKSSELERYSDKYRPSVMSQPTLKRKALHAPFFPAEVFEDYFNPKGKRKALGVGPRRVKINLEELGEEGEEEKSSDERSDAGSQAVESDYDVDEEYDNDYADNYFDNGEGDDPNDIVGGGGDDGGGDD